MPEGDTVWRTATRLHQALAGQRLTGAELRWGALIDLDLVGATTTEVRSRGKHLLHRLDTGLTIHSHLRMEGQWRVEATERGFLALGGGPTWLAAFLLIWYWAEVALSRWNGWPATWLDIVMLPLRDLLIYALWLATFLRRGIEWRGHTLPAPRQFGASL